MWTFEDTEGARDGDHAFLVYGDGGQGGGDRARGDHDVLGVDGGRG